MTDDATLRDRIGAFLDRNFPQIEMHGGSWDIADLDPESGEVHVLLSGACDGCGISNLTTEALKARLVAEIPELSHVTVETGMGEEDRPTKEDLSDVPF
ncbi:NifU family protein [Haloarchaeobius sp. HRN-SO-5]|uniref:NifU family protein n=1 Tax=Haloarchaeobius sp. HRN-SO-5 TaxID=3446118 RepID=UPI003EBBAC18